jgi:hypothetical protein
MSQSSGENIVEVKPAVNVYTGLILLAIIALGVGIYFVVMSLFSPAPQGYGYQKFEDLFVPPDKQKETTDQEIGTIPNIDVAKKVYREVEKVEK